MADNINFGLGGQIGQYFNPDSMYSNTIAPNGFIMDDSYNSAVTGIYGHNTAANIAAMNNQAQYERLLQELQGNLDVTDAQGRWAVDLADTKGQWDMDIQDLVSGRNLKGVTHAADQRLTGDIYGANAARDASMFGAQAGLQGTMYGADANLAGNMYNTDAQRDIAGMGLEGTKYGWDAQADIANINQTQHHLRNQRFNQMLPMIQGLLGYTPPAQPAAAPTTPQKPQSPWGGQVSYAMPKMQPGRPSGEPMDFKMKGLSQMGGPGAGYSPQAKLGLNKGGVVPGYEPRRSGPKTDVVNAKLTKGEGVLNKEAMSLIGEGQLELINAWAQGRTPRSGPTQNSYYTGGMIRAAAPTPTAPPAPAGRMAPPALGPTPTGAGGRPTFTAQTAPAGIPYGNDGIKQGADGSWTMQGGPGNPSPVPAPAPAGATTPQVPGLPPGDRKSTRLNSSH